MLLRHGGVAILRSALCDYRIDLNNRSDARGLGWVEWIQRVVLGWQLTYINSMRERGST